MAAVALLATAAPVPQMTAVERFNADLLGGRTATELLEARCAELGLADPPRVHAEVQRSRRIARSAAARVRLGIGKEEALGYRRVRLMCGAHVLSEALNWYVPARLTPAMNAQLEQGDTPFGRVILPLSPSRRTLSARVLWDGRGRAPATILRHRALVIDGQGRPLAEVIENYRAILVTGMER